MQNVRNKMIAGAVAASLLSAPIVATKALPAPYKDGCSGGMSWFHRNVLGNVPTWEHCCDAHDRLYGPGGTADQRAAADWALFQCVRGTGHPWTGLIMWVAVKVGGQPFFPFGWRWGFERPYEESWWFDRSGAE